MENLRDKNRADASHLDGIFSFLNGWAVGYTYRSRTSEIWQKKNLFKQDLFITVRLVKHWNK